MKARLPVHGLVPVAILLDEEITLADLKVYTVLASFQGSNDDAYPSREAIVTRCGLAVETISRAVKHLMELGWIQRQQRGQNQTNIYRVMVETGSDLQVTSGSDSLVTPEVTPKSLPSTRRNLKRNTRQEKGDSLFSDTDQNSVTPEEVLALLNEITGSSYRSHKGTGLTKLIATGYTLDDFRAVFTEKTREWKGGEFEKYLCPDTLFRVVKFEKYLEQAKHQRGGRPEKFKASTFDETQAGYRVETM